MKKESVSAFRNKSKKALAVLALLLAFIIAVSGCSMSSKRMAECIALGEQQLAEGKYDEAIETFTRAIEIDEDSPLPYAYRGDIYLRQGDYKKAIQDYTLALEKEKTPENYDRLIKAYRSNGQNDKVAPLRSEAYETTKDEKYAAADIDLLDSFIKGFSCVGNFSSGEYNYSMIYADDAYAYFTVYDGNYGIVKYDLLSGKPTRIVSEHIYKENAIVLNDRLYYVSEDKLYSTDLNGKDKKKLCGVKYGAKLYPYGENILVVDTQETSAAYDTEDFYVYKTVVSQDGKTLEARKRSKIVGSYAKDFPQIASDGKTVYINGIDSKQIYDLNTEKPVVDVNGSICFAGSADGWLYYTNAVGILQQYDVVDYVKRWDPTANKIEDVSIPAKQDGLHLFRVSAVIGENIYLEYAKFKDGDPVFNGNGSAKGYRLYSYRYNIATQELICLDKQGAYKVDTDPYLNIRKGAGTDTSVIGRLRDGQRVDILESKNGWGKVYVDGRYGWVAMKYLVK